MKNKKILLLLLVIILIIVLFVIIKNSDIIIGNEELNQNEEVSKELIESSVKCKVDSIYLDESTWKMNVLLKEDNKIYNASFIEDLSDYKFYEIINEGDELFVDAKIDSDTIYISKIYKNVTIEERQVGE